MVSLLIRRLLLLVPVVFGIVLVVFIIVRAIPGDPCVAFLGERATPAACEAFRERYGLNESIPVQFVKYLGGMAQGDFGTSIKTGQPVVDVIAQRLPMTFELAICATLFATIVGISLGLVSALRRNTPVDVGTMIIANIGVSMPVFWLGLMLAYVFALVLKGTIFYIPPSSRLSAGISLVPLAKYWNLTDLQGIPKFVIGLISNSSILNGLIRGDFKLIKDALWHLILPSLAVGTIPLAVIARMTRSSLLEVLGLDYIRTARAKGLVEFNCHLAACFPERLNPNCYGCWTGIRSAFVGGSADGNCVYSAGGRHGPGDRYPFARLSAGAGVYHCRCLNFRVRQSCRRYLLCLPGSSDPIGLMYECGYNRSQFFR